MLRNIRLAIRVLASHPGFTLVAALSLALGIGANSAIFSLVDSLWFRPLAVPDSGRIVRVFGVTDQNREAFLSYPEYLDFKSQATSLTDLVIVGSRGARLLEGDGKELVTLNLVSPNFFTALGVKAQVGRVFTPQDESNPAAALDVVLGNAFWQRRFGGDPSIVGKQIRIQRINNVLATVIGVLPPSFREIETGSDRDLWFSRPSWTQIGVPADLEARGSRWFMVLGRLTPGASAQQANEQIRTIAARMADAYPASNKNRRASVVPDVRYRLEQAGTNGLALLAIVMLVVLISSVNVANLLLSRAGSRGREFAVRLALGASRGRLVSQLMCENLVLGFLGLLLGLGLGAVLVSILPSLIVTPPGFHGTSYFEFDSRVLVFSFLVSMATVLFFGLAPSWRAARPDLVPALKGESAFGDSGHGRWHVRNWLVIAQVAVSMTLLVSAGVLVRSFANTRISDLGFGRKPLLLVWMSEGDATPQMFRDIVTHFEGMPGVRNVAVAVRAPLSLSSNGMFQLVSFPGRPDLSGEPPFEIKYNSVSPNFLSTMGTPLLRGRPFDERDNATGADAVLINEKMAQRFWPGEDPVGKTIQTGFRTRRARTVVGVVKNAPINAVGEPPEPYLYLPFWSNFEEEATFLIETATDPTGLAQTARRELKTVSPKLDPLTITTENELIRYSAQKFQITAELVGALGILGLILTAVGLYGVVSYGVSQRTRELGIRMALGADRSDTERLVLGEVARLGLTGIGIGLPLALAATRMMKAMLFGVGPWDVATFAAAGVLLAVVLFLAGFLPARQATGIEPLSALRAE